MSTNDLLPPPTGLIVLIHHKIEGRWVDEWLADERLRDVQGAADVALDAIRDMGLSGETADHPSQHVRAISVTGADHTDEVLDEVAARFIANSEAWVEHDEWVEARRHGSAVNRRVQAIRAANTARIAADLAKHHAWLAEQGAAA